MDTSEEYVCSELHNIRCLFGEDRWFCIRAVAHGFDIFTDSRYMPLRLYRRSIYEQYRKKKTGGTRDAAGVNAYSAEPVLKNRGSAKNKIKFR